MAIRIVGVDVLVAACLRPTVPASGSDLVLEGTRWQAVSILGRPPLPQAVPTLRFENHAEASGTAGCNGFGTSEFTASGGAIDFGELGQTAMLCSDEAIMEQETRYFRALNDAQRAELREGHLVVSGPEGEVVFERIEVAG